MSITIVCRTCGKTGQVPMEFQGHRVVCPQCNQKFLVADAPDAGRSAAPAVRVPKDQAEVLILTD